MLVYRKTCQKSVKGSFLFKPSTVVQENSPEFFQNCRGFLFFLEVLPLMRHNICKFISNPGVS